MALFFLLFYTKIPLPLVVNESKHPFTSCRDFPPSFSSALLWGENPPILYFFITMQFRVFVPPATTSPPRFDPPICPCHSVLRRLVFFKRFSSTCCPCVPTSQILVLGATLSYHQSSKGLPPFAPPPPHMFLPFLMLLSVFSGAPSLSL